MSDHEDTEMRSGALGVPESMPGGGVTPTNVPIREQVPYPAEAYERWRRGCETPEDRQDINKYLRTLLESPVNQDLAAR